MKIVFLVVDYVPHQILSIKTLIEKHQAQVLAYYVGKFVKDVPELPHFSTHQYQSQSKEEILRSILDFQPDIVVTAGWFVSEYNWLSKQLRKKTAVPIVAMSDTPWYGTLRQKINVLSSPFHVKKMFTHVWVAGIRQYDYSRKLGFSNDQIIFNSLSANNRIFEHVDIDKKRSDYPKNFLYIGRYTPIKGLRNLAEAWAAISDKKGWTFTLVGSGEIGKELKATGNFIVKDFMPQDSLLREMQHAGCFVLPSLHEPWALVLHEAVGAGLPIICTETCGAAPHFVINNYNGYRIKDNSVADLKIKLKEIINKDEAELITFSKRSRALSTAINPEIQAASLLQILNG